MRTIRLQHSFQWYMSQGSEGHIWGAAGTDPGTTCSDLSQKRGVSKREMI